MAEYIDREALKNDGHLCYHDGKGTVYYEVDHAPAADVVEVVRCKDCKHFREYTNEYKRNVENADGDCYIRVMYSDYYQFDAVQYHDFCSMGAKMDGKGEG